MQNVSDSGVRYNSGALEHTREQIVARWLAQKAVRNSELENLHAGVSPSSATGDFSDVKIVSPYGEIPWPSAGRISDPEMRALMLDIEANLVRDLTDMFSILSKGSMKRLEAILPNLETTLFGPMGVSWDIGTDEWERSLQIRRDIEARCDQEGHKPKSHMRDDTLMVWCSRCGITIANLD